MKSLDSSKDHGNFTDSKNQESGNAGGEAGKIKQMIEENQIVMSKRPTRHFLSQTTEENPTSIPHMDNQHHKSQLKTQQEVEGKSPRNLVTQRNAFHIFEINT